MPDSRHSAPSNSAHIGLVLEQICRQARLTPRTLAHKTGTAPGYVIEVLAGRNFPTRNFTVRCAQACGADTQVLIKIWDDERARATPRAHTSTDNRQSRTEEP
ncbi:helix-turn-helix domain-containing protein [Streptomyces acidiscabies]|uniref:Helix-turn-helix transcriptional regulator n=1 Tax=Streptomyces acidiscabies TaxID=42234 RepID=A0AAP6EM96_9ACTN|nr:helix-turn-helix transcriptional regulator [Streptomyces acidiscabies]MBP5935475.1 helix-turn-helix domain-containing protein [Streptomyces sp. LBUM 1476]MBZ3916662.1 helix-turn-helix transcriptional regulator [Streptomyces acidiscabies]MDX2967161.1 helix-turn-helix transcriptional regulator [Streptomyces acidiscabies]MDX3025435.1 helix-turn-helix transcriptional regulator [Streptomyces acidiscabies]MDX3795977.1 helix-turn-helix transcriptional regulator [Streptomyces acidiscabies]